MYAASKTATRCIRYGASLYPVAPLCCRPTESAETYKVAELFIGCTGSTFRRTEFVPPCAICHNQ
jgi:hypothetical protein